MEFVKAKMLTRQTYTLGEISASMEVKDGKAQLKEIDGMDYAIASLQLPDMERINMIFSVKDLNVKSSTAGPIKPGFDLSGTVRVPSYRMGNFQDTKGRGAVFGYEMAPGLVALQTGLQGDDKHFRENNKVYENMYGNVELSVTNVNAADGEFSGIFVSNQPSATDMGSLDPKAVLLKGVFSATIEEDA